LAYIENQKLMTVAETAALIGRRLNCGQRKTGTRSWISLPPTPTPAMSSRIPAVCVRFAGAVRVSANAAGCGLSISTTTIRCRSTCC
jgi:hypothetical protein